MGDGMMMGAKSGMTNSEPQEGKPYEGLDFPTPAGLELPKGSDDGSEVDMLATFKVRGSDLCLVAVEGIPIKESEPKTDPGASDPGDSFEGAVEKGL